MSGPEHYREAERPLAIPVSTAPQDQGAVIALHLAAQAHATLSLATATAEPWLDDCSERSGAYLHRDWVEAIA